MFATRPALLRAQPPPNYLIELQKQLHFAMEMSREDSAKGGLSQQFLKIDPIKIKQPDQFSETLAEALQNIEWGIRTGL
jgi:hypothetical protein